MTWVFDTPKYDFFIFRMQELTNLGSTWEYDVKVVDILNAMFIYWARFEDVGFGWGRWFLAS